MLEAAVSAVVQLEPQAVLQAEVESLDDELTKLKTTRESLAAELRTVTDQIGALLERHDTAAHNLGHMVGTHPSLPADLMPLLEQIGSVSPDAQPKDTT